MPPPCTSSQIHGRCRHGQRAPLPTRQSAERAVKEPSDSGHAHVALSSSEHLLLLITLFPDSKICTFSQCTEVTMQPVLNVSLHGDVLLRRFFCRESYQINNMRILFYFILFLKLAKLILKILRENKQGRKPRKILGEKQKGREVRKAYQLFKMYFNRNVTEKSRMGV